MIARTLMLEMVKLLERIDQYFSALQAISWLISTVLLVLIYYSLPIISRLILTEKSASSNRRASLACRMPSTTAPRRCQWGLLWRKTPEVNWWVTADTMVIEDHPGARVHAVDGAAVTEENRIQMIGAGLRQQGQ